jgi:hypothetical protein
MSQDLKPQPVADFPFSTDKQKMLQYFARMRDGKATLRLGMSILTLPPGSIGIESNHVFYDVVVTRPASKDTVEVKAATGRSLASVGPQHEKLVLLSLKWQSDANRAVELVDAILVAIEMDDAISFNVAKSDLAQLGTKHRQL